jgi:hypothetical protein
MLNVITAPLVGVIRYFSVQKALVNGFFPAARTVVAGIAIVLAVLVMIMFGILVSGKFGRLKDSAVDGGENQNDKNLLVKIAGSP